MHSCFSHGGHPSLVEITTPQWEGPCKCTCDLPDTLIMIATSFSTRSLWRLRLSKESDCMYRTSAVTFLAVMETGGNNYSVSLHALRPYQYRHDPPNIMSRQTIKSLQKTTTTKRGQRKKQNTRILVASNEPRRSRILPL